MDAHRERQVIETVAAGRIVRLFELAEERTRINDAESKALAKRYIRLLRKIGAHYRISIPKRIKDRICKSCNSVLVPGLNCTVRLSSSEKCAIYKCECGAEKRVFYSEGP
ncbi:MAG: hypothetical protein QXV17_02560 [Candidatus Micrarchaeaceae archaeon]